MKLYSKKLPFQEYSTNIFLRDSAYELSFNPIESKDNSLMTLNGIIGKVYILLLLTVISSRFSWNAYNTWWNTEINFIAIALISLWFSVCIGFFAFFFKTRTKFIAPFSAFFLGFTLGPLSAHVDSQLPGVIVIALLITTGIFLGTLILYQINPYKRLDVAWVALFGVGIGICTLYSSIFLMNIFGLEMTYPHELSIFIIIPLCIIFFGSIITMLASFEFIVYQIQQKRLAELEWYSAFALFISIVWLYVDILLYLLRKSNNL
ncbi:MAG TPA: hypothetical protein DCL80_10135 [Balneola sp.]|nr:hypothetical protein [Balneola sp.]